MSSFDKAVEELSANIRLLSDDDVLRKYRSDALREFRGFRRTFNVARLAVVFPKDAYEVVHVVKTANKFRVPVVPVGGLTGLMGGAMPVTDCIIVDMKPMNRVLHVSEEDRLVSCEAGITIDELDKRLAAHGLMTGHDPWTRKYATVGGCIAANGMGYTAAGYGSIRRQVLGLEVVLPTGEVLRTRDVEDSSTGPSLTQLFIGSEGTLGIITKATMRVYPLPEKRTLAGYRFEGFEKGFRALLKFYTMNLIPSALEYGEVFDAPSDPEQDYESELFVMFEGMEEVVDVKTKIADVLCRGSGGERVDESRVMDFWQHRHDIADFYVENVGRNGLWHDVFFDFIHVSLPATKVLDYRRLSAQVLKKHQLLVVDRGIWKQPENFSIAYLRQKGLQPRKDLSEFLTAFDELVESVQGLGGSMEYCHGVGIKMAKHMSKELGQAGLEVLRRIKSALDPNNIMNPGKLLPV